MRLILDRHEFAFPPLRRAGPVADVAMLVLVGVLLAGHVGGALRTGRAPAAAPAATPVARQAVLVIHPDGRWTLGGQVVPPAQLEAELARVFADRPVRTLFVAPSAVRTWGEVDAVRRRAAAAGITVGVLPAP